MRVTHKIKQWNHRTDEDILQQVNTLMLEEWKDPQSLDPGIKRERSKPSKLVS